MSNYESFTSLLDYFKNHWGHQNLLKMLKVWYVLNIYLQYKLHHFQNRSDCFNTAFTTSTEPLGNPIDCPWPPEVHFVSKSCSFIVTTFHKRLLELLVGQQGCNPWLHIATNLVWNTLFYSIPAYKFAKCNTYIYTTF